MLGAWCCAKTLAIDHMRQPGQGVPVGGMTGGESPNNVGGRQPGGDVWIVENVVSIVYGDVTVRAGWGVDGEADQRDQPCDNPDCPRPSRFRVRRRADGLRLRTRAFPTHVIKECSELASV